MSGRNNPFRDGRGGRGRGQGSGNRTRQSHPPNLTGKEIGMYYRDRARKSEDFQQSYAPILKVPEELIDRIITKLKTSGVSTFTEEVSKEFSENFDYVLGTNFDTFVKRFTNLPKTEDQKPLDEFFAEELKEMRSTLDYKERLKKREKLPVYERRDDILRAIEENNVILISGDTGSGKTTQVPQFILDDVISKNNGSKCNIVCTQPRRISAITIAERVAWERCERLGRSVGYSIRLETVKPRDNGSLVYCTTGTLLRKLQDDPLLNGISHLILDEIHERNIETDLLLVILKKIHQYRPSLKLILMSATFAIEKFAKYFNNCEIIDVKGSLFPVEELYLEDVIEEIKFNKFPQQKQPQGYRKHLKKYKDERQSNSIYDDFIGPYVRNMRSKYSKQTMDAILNPESEKVNIDFLESLIFHISEKKDHGGILVFLPGYQKISDLLKALTRSPRYSASKFWIFPLHSMMQTSEQKKIFEPAPSHIRKVILATTIAETSITIDDIVYVINSGKVKFTDFDVESNCQTLEEHFTTLANSRQRKGRAGRVKPGVCYHLYTRARKMTLDLFPTPEILRSRLEGVILNLKVLHLNDVQELFKEMLDKPSPEVVGNGLTLLKRIGALDVNELLTPLGLHLARLPIDPQMGKMLVMGALFQCIDPISTVASALSHKEPFYTVIGKESQLDREKEFLAGDTKSDHLLMVNVINEFRKAKENCYEQDFAYKHFLSIPILKEIERMKVQFMELLESTKFVDSSNPQNSFSNLNSKNVNLLRAIIAAGLYPNVAFLKRSKRIRNQVQTIHALSTPEDRSIKFHKGSSNNSQSSFDSKYFVFYLKRRSGGVSLLDSSMVYPMALVIFGDRVSTSETGISVGHMNFKCNQKTTELVMEIRRLMNNLLKKKALHPSPIDKGSSDAVLLDCLQMLLQLDDVDYTECKEDDDFDCTF
ncbi:hypothetical protein ACFFRR_004136 [Megaselia abdita]